MYQPEKAFYSRYWNEIVAWNVIVGFFLAGEGMRSEDCWERFDSLLTGLEAVSIHVEIAVCETCTRWQVCINAKVELGWLSSVFDTVVGIGLDVSFLKRPAELVEAII